MREKAVRFGQTTALIGVVTEPASPAAETGRPGVVLLNSGLLHHVGAARLHVRLARALAGEGYPVLRFDFSGVGDSDPRRDSLSFEQSAVLEVREAMDYLATTRGPQQFILAGLCSGADMAYLSALDDARVVGLVQLDAWVYRTWRYYVHRYGPRLFNWSSWRNLLTGRTYVGPLLRRWIGGAAAGEPAEEDVFISPYAREFPPRSEIAQGLARLLARGVRCLNLFSSGQPEHCNYADQYRHCLSAAGVDLGDRVEVHYLAAADHIFSGLAHQQFVVDTTLAWLRRQPAARVA